MKKIVFATNNKKKLAEVREILNGIFDVVSLQECGCIHEIEETGKTFAENAVLKAKHVFDVHGLDCFADDSGLEVESLNGAPGVYSARFAGEPSNDSNNNALLLKKLDGALNRSASFKTVIALCENGCIQHFRGEIIGEIAIVPRGNSGFGYDPLFIPVGSVLTFAEMSSDEKNRISHRAIAVNKLVDYLKRQVT
jgi:XTP/dITP diphosphohydrolase